METHRPIEHLPLTHEEREAIYAQVFDLLQPRTASQGVSEAQRWWSKFRSAFLTILVIASSVLGFSPSLYGKQMPGAVGYAAGLIAGICLAILLSPNWSSVNSGTD